MRSMEFPSPSRSFGSQEEAIAHSRFEVVARRAVTPLVWGDLEAGCLAERWK